MIGEFTEKCTIYEKLAKANGVEITKEIKDFVTDIVAYEDQTEEKKILTEEQQKILEKLREKNLFKEYIKENYGSFYFNFYKEVIDMLKPQNITRALYLSCFANYNNILVEDNKTRTIPLYEEDLQRILKLSRTETFRTKKDLIESGFLIINEDKTLSINKKYCLKGEVPKRNKNEKVRMFSESIKEIYIKSQPKEHKKISLLFRLLPYINLRWNIVCYNVEEELKEKIIPYRLKSLCEELEQSNVTKFKKDLLSITVGGQPSAILTSVMDKNMITINPRIYYKGTKLEELREIETDIINTLNSK